MTNDGFFDGEAVEFLIEAARRFARVIEIDDWGEALAYREAADSVEAALESQYAEAMKEGA